MIQFKGVISPIKNFTDGSFRVSIDVPAEQVENIVEVMKNIHMPVVAQFFLEDEVKELVQQSESELRQNIYKKIMNAGCTDHRRELYSKLYHKDHLSDFTIQELQDFNAWLGDSKNYAPLRERILEAVK